MSSDVARRNESTPPADPGVINKPAHDAPKSNAILEQVVLSIDADLEELCFISSQEKNIALVDLACPTTVAGIDWMKNYIKSLPDDRRKAMRFINSDRMYKFGGVERRQSMGVVSLPCTLGGKLEANIRT